MRTRRGIPPPRSATHVAELEAQEAAATPQHAPRLREAARHSHAAKCQEHVLTARVTTATNECGSRCRMRTLQTVDAQTLATAYVAELEAHEAAAAPQHAPCLRDAA
eukprot:TRINITY_DN9369_c0_g1_i1.p1 TRINITY_DN9369_c0_g1~~TRINITY_DN9369_c0_g1_i1.p1  ORF type:complete len:107 (-),score=11.50 TRINITY_DN9369_c0_g1_i1:127-447(-)